MLVVVLSLHSILTLVLSSFLFLLHNSLAHSTVTTHILDLGNCIVGHSSLPTLYTYTYFVIISLSSLHFFTHSAVSRSSPPSLYTYSYFIILSLFSLHSLVHSRSSSSHLVLSYCTDGHSYSPPLLTYTCFSILSLSFSHSLVHFSSSSSHSCSRTLHRSLLLFTYTCFIIHSLFSSHFLVHFRSSSSHSPSHTLRSWSQFSSLHLAPTFLDCSCRRGSHVVAYVRSATLTSSPATIYVLLNANRSARRCLSLPLALAQLSLCGCGGHFAESTSRLFARSADFMPRFGDFDIFSE